MTETDQQVDTPEGMAKQPLVLGAIMGVMHDVRGVAKAGEMRASTAVNAKIQYRFQRFDDVAEVVGKAFRDHGVMLQAKITRIDYHTWDKQNSSGGTTMWTSCRLVKQFFFTSLVDGSTVEFEACGEGSDSSDKATNKAETSALKNALKQAFMLSTGEEDPDDTRPQVTGQNVQIRNAQARQQDPWRAVEDSVAASPAGFRAPQAQLDRALKGIDALSRCRTTGDAFRLAQWAFENELLGVNVGPGGSLATHIVTACGTLRRGPPSPTAQQTAPPQSAPGHQPSERADTPPDDHHGGY